MSWQDIRHHYEDGPEEPDIPEVCVRFGWDKDDPRLELRIDGDEVNNFVDLDLAQKLRDLITRHYQEEEEDRKREQWAIDNPPAWDPENDPF